MSEAKPSSATPLDELSGVEQPWWRRYSPHGEFPWSSSMSFVFHVFLILLIIVLAGPLSRRDPTPPMVDVIYVGPDDNAAPGDGNEPLGDDALEPSFDDEPFQALLPSVLTEQVDPVEAPDVIDPQVVPEINPAETAAATAAAERALEEVRRAQDQLARNLNRHGGKKGGGGGGTGRSGRAARVARWILHFNTRSPSEYLGQLDGLGATVAFPRTGDKWLYFDHASSPNRTSSLRDLSNEGRLYWIDDNLPSVSAVCGVLGLSTAPFMVVFLPQELEDRMLKLELAYNNLEEDEIASTHFEAVRRGGRLDVVVSRQIPR